MNTRCAARRALIGWLLAAPAWPAHSQTAAQAPVTASAESWWFYLNNDRAREIQALLAAGADPNTRDAHGQPALMRAVEHNAWAVFDALAADPRVDLNIENPAGETPLMYLAIAGQTARAHTLIRRGARVNKLGWTPLHYAAARAQPAVAKLLLAAGAMPNAPSPQGRTPLMMAAYAGSAELVQLLLEHGADPTTRDVRGHDAADWAREQNAQALADALRRVIDERLQRRAEQRRTRPNSAAQRDSEADTAGDRANVEVFPLW